MTIYKETSPESESQPGSRGRVLRNRLGIRRMREIRRVESDALESVQDWAVDQFDDGHRFTVSDIQLLHRQWLGGVYEWAGEYRVVNISKGDFPFAAAGRIPHLMQEFEEKYLSRFTPCSGMDESALAEALAHTHAELVLIHPFRDGNGRCARLLAWLMGMQADYPPLDFSPMSGRGRKIHFAAVQCALDGDYEPMKRCFSRVIARTLKDGG